MKKQPLKTLDLQKKTSTILKNIPIKDRNDMNQLIKKLENPLLHLFLNIKLIEEEHNKIIKALNQLF